jgi:hypothetical protein
MDRIVVPHGVRKKLKRIFNRSYPFIHSALLGLSDHPDAARVRKAALENGGVLLSETELK